jgi:CDP-L-myo-inositol myo-inositolphosphotransferase
VDHRLDQIWDLAESTKVRLGREAIVAIGKGITQFDAVDTGVFLCEPAIFSALETARREGDYSVSAGVRNLIPSGEIRGVDIGDRFWLDVDTPEDLAHAKRLLLDRLSKPSEDGFVARHLNRPISQRISGLLARTSIRPNTITVLSFLICVSGALLFSFGQYLYTAIAGVLIQFSSIVDGCDGEIARLKLQTSRFGAWLDTLLDRYAEVFVAAGISYGYWRDHPSAITWLIGMLALMGFVLASYMKKEYALRFLEKPPHGIVSKLIKRDFRLLALAVAALLNHPFHGLVIAGAISHLGIGWIFLKTYRSQKRIQPRR